MDPCHLNVARHNVARIAREEDALGGVGVRCFDHCKPDIWPSVRPLAPKNECTHAAREGVPAWLDPERLPRVIAGTKRVLEKLVDREIGAIVPPRHPDRRRFQRPWLGK
jgi:hypothetical protein